jgi:polysaccharide chain length determinant protein (PEP-CTERM system associated)
VRGDSFRVTYSAGDPMVAMKVTQQLAAMFIEENLRDREVQAEGTNDFLEAQLEAARNRLLEHEKRLEKYRLQYAGELPSQSQMNLTAVLGHRQQLQAVAESINRDRDRRLMLERTHSEVSASDTGQTAAERTTAAAPRENEAERRLETARDNLRGMLLRLKPDHPDVIVARRQILELEGKLQSAPAPTAAPVPETDVRSAIADATRRSRMKQIQAEIDNVDRQIAAKETEAERLRQQIDEYQRRVDAAPTRETEMTELMRDYKTLQDVYVGLLEKKEASKLAANLERAQAGEQFKILDPARVPERPFSPNHFQTVSIGAVVGLGLGLALAVLLELRDSTVRTEEEVVRLLALPVVAVVPLMHTAIDRRRVRRLVAGVGFAIVILAGLFAAALAKQLGKLG